MLSEKYLKMTQLSSSIGLAYEASLKRAAEIGSENVFDYSIGNPSVPAPEQFADAIVDIVRHIPHAELHSYCHSGGAPALREAIVADLNARFGMQYRPEDIFIASGAAGAMAHALRAVVSPGEEVITFAPFFPEYAPYVDGAGGILKVVPANIDTFQINFQAFEELICEKTAAVIIDSPNNPTGVVYTEQTLRRLAEILEAKQAEFGHPIYLLSDEPYREIVFSGFTVPCVPKYYENTLICYSFSKSLSIPGQRLGYIAVAENCANHEHLLPMFSQISRFIGHDSTSVLIQLAAAKTIGQTADLSVYERNKNLLYPALTGMGYECVEPGGTFYLFPRSPEADANAFCAKAQEENLFLVPGDTFGCKGHFRLSYCVPTEKVERSLDAFYRLIRHYHAENGSS